MDMLRLNCEWSDDLIIIPNDEDASDCVKSALLILEVEMRPMLYLKSMYQELSSKDILKVWSEVADVLNADRKIIFNKNSYSEMG